MRAFGRYSPLWLGMFAGAACAGLVGSLRFSEPDHLLFPHARHEKAGVDCVACHESVFDATDLKERHLPKEAKCLECHKAKKEAGECSFCHSDPSNIQPRPAPSIALTYDHSKHIELMNEECSRCHTELPQAGKPARPPEMTACFQSCHDPEVKNPHVAAYDQGRCTTCHQDLWRKPLRPESTYSHDADFLHEHPAAARSSSAACSQCHAQTFCSDCHAATVPVAPNKVAFDRVDRSFVHRTNFLAMHPSEANADPASCERCHTTTSCESCHDALGFGAGARNPRNPHPVGWALPGSADFHGEAAQREIGTCVACHDQGGKSDCLTCHKVGGVGGNPHPSDFLSRYRQVDRRNPMCLECHL